MTQAQRSSERISPSAKPPPPKPELLDHADGKLERHHESELSELVKEQQR